MPRSREPAVALPALLLHLMRAAAADHRRPGRRRGSGHAAALHDLARLVALALPARGVLAPDDELCDAIDRIADRHLGRGEAGAQLRAALSRVDDLHVQDAIDAAHAAVVDVSQIAHYYAGLAAGITLAGLGAGPWVIDDRAGRRAS